MILIAIFLPWLSFILRGHIIRGIICLILQITVLGWLPAAIWAVVSDSNDRNDKRLKELEKYIVNKDKL
jgi:uncharacterized membrane protein YqaE (UPF0057 family)